MATIFKSALRLFSGSAKREELASELSDKLYAGRGGSATMSELGIELEKPGAKPSAPAGLAKPGADSSASAGGANTANSQPGDEVAGETRAGRGAAREERLEHRARRSPCSDRGEGEGEPRADFDSNRALRDVGRASLQAADGHQKMISCSRISPR